MEHMNLSSVTKKYLASFHECIDYVSRERKYLASVEPPDVSVLYDAIDNGISKKLPITMAVVDEKVVGWCSIAHNQREGFWH